MKVILIFAFSCFQSWNLIKAKKSLNMDPIAMTDWDLPGDDQYSLFYEITSENFKTRVLLSPDVWIILLVKGNIQKKWRRHAEKMKAALWYGTIDMEKESELVEKWIGKISNRDLEEGAALVFPFSMNAKRAMKPRKGLWPKQVAEPQEAENVAKSSIPDVTEKFTFSQSDMEHFQQWIVQSYYHFQPPKYPVICVTDEPEPHVPLTLLSISNYFSQFFSFGLVHKTNVQRLLSIMKQVPVPQKYPHYLVFFGSEPTKKEMDEGKYGLTFDIMPFIHMKYGEPDQFLAVVKFFFALNEDQRERLLGRRTDEPEYLQKMLPVSDALTGRVVDIKPRHIYSVKTEL